MEGILKRFYNITEINDSTTRSTMLRKVPKITTSSQSSSLPMTSSLFVLKRNCLPNKDADALSFHAVLPSHRAVWLVLRHLEKGRESSWFIESFLVIEFYTVLRRSLVSNFKLKWVTFVFFLTLILMYSTLRKSKRDTCNLWWLYK